MKTTKRLLLVAPFLLLTAPLVSLQLPQLSNPSPGGPASIEGVVVSLGTNRPVSGVDVELSRVRGTENAPMDPAAEAYFEAVLDGPGAWGSEPDSRIIDEVRYFQTGSDGRFTFTGLPEGTYRLVASQPYARGDHYPVEYGQHDPRGRGLNFPIAAGEAVRDIRLEMMRPGTIVGTVQDYDGEPMAYVGILALHVQYRNGQRILNVEQAVYTDDHGQYRLYWLGPGEYHVAAVVEDPWRRSIRSDPIPAGRRGPTERATSPYISSRILPTGEVVEETYAMVYNGGVLDSSNAPVLRIESGSILNADIPMGAGRVPAAHIRGVVIDATTGRPAAGASVRAVPRQWSPSVFLLEAMAGPDGRFDLVGAIPGAYDLIATHRSDSATAGYLPVETMGSDVGNVSLAVGPSIGIQGRLFLEGAAAGAIADRVTGIRVSVVRDPDILGAPTGMGSAPQAQAEAAFSIGLSSSASNGRVDESGSFPLYVFPGRYRVNVQGVPAGAYLDAVRLGNADVLAGGLTVTRTPGAPLDVVLGTDGGALEGRVLDEDGAALANAVVALSPEPADLRQRVDLNLSATSSADGRFSLQSIPPGVYKLFAWRYVEAGAWMDRAFRNRYDALGTLVYVEPDSRQQSELTVLPER